MVEEFAKLLFHYTEMVGRSMKIGREHIIRSAEGSRAISSERAAAAGSSAAWVEVPIEKFPSYMKDWSVGTPRRNWELTGKILVRCNDRAVLRAYYSIALEEGYTLEKTQVPNSVLVVPPS